MMEVAGYGRVLNAYEVARLFCVSDATVRRWDRAGKLDNARTQWPHRYSEAAILALLAGSDR